MPITQHMGSLHPAESILVLVVAFGPFLVLAVIAVLRNRRTPPHTQDSPTQPTTNSRTVESDDSANNPRKPTAQPRGW
jgi:hypothetical protein